MLLLIDNYDSFVFNLARYFQRLGQETVVRRNDELDADAVIRLGATAIVLSPGPCTPTEAGCSLDIVRQLHTRLPILGVCLGHQTIAAALGGKVIRAADPVHGRASSVRHNDRGLFAGLPNPLTACRYHSLIVEESSLPACLEPTAWTADGTLMALERRPPRAPSLRRAIPPGINPDRLRLSAAGEFSETGWFGDAPGDSSAERRARQGG